MSTSSWGRELKWLSITTKEVILGRPLREVVSWNMYAWSACIDGEEGRPLREVVSWNISIIIPPNEGQPVDLFVRSWVEISTPSQTGQK